MKENKLKTSVLKACFWFQDDSLSDKNVPTPRKVLPSVSPPSVTPTKRRKGAPVRICKQNEEGEDSDNSLREDDILGEDNQMSNSIKEEKLLEEIENRQVCNF